MEGDSYTKNSTLECQCCLSVCLSVSPDASEAGWEGGMTGSRVGSTGQNELYFYRAIEWLSEWLSG